MRSILLVSLFVPGLMHAADLKDLDGKTLKCGANVVMFRDHGDRVVLNGVSGAVEWTDDGRAALFDDHHLQVLGPDLFTFDRVICTTLHTTW